MSGIFISYRREDCAAYAGRLYDWISQRLGKENIFIDVDTIQPGEDFVEAIEQKVGGCDALLALIGKEWLNCRDEHGNRRVDSPGDFVRLEIMAALNRSVRVIPVLVEGARMPAERDLPEPLTKLARRQALELSFTRFHQDANRLIETLEKALAAADETRKVAQERRALENAVPIRRAPEKEESPKPAAMPEEPPNRALPFPARRRKTLLAVPAIAVAAVIGGATLWYASKPVVRPASQPDRPTSRSPAQPLPPAEQPPVIEAFTVDHGVLHLGGSATLRWRVHGGSSVTLDPGMGPAPDTGTLVVTPQSSTTYDLVVRGPGGVVRQSLTVTVESPRLPVPSPPTIEQFTAQPTPVVRNRRTTLRWKVRGSTSVTLSPGIGKVGATGTLVITPQASTAYELVARGPGGVTRRSIPITAEPPPPSVPGPPTIEQFAVEPNPVIRDQQATLRWTVRGGTSVALSPDIGTVTQSGTWTVTPHSSTTYELAARGPGGVATARVDLTVTPPAAPRITVDFSASSPIQRGDSSVLRWNVSNAEHVSIDQGIGRVEHTGSRKVSPSETTVYKLTASGGGQERESTVRIVVNARSPRSPTSGLLVWKGDLQAFGVLIIDAASVTRGTVHGALPGVPVRISVPPEMKVMEAPSQQNGWQRLVLQNNAHKRDEVKITWQLILP
jgi:hypothetical protein